jgi:hypothetical protein
MDNMDKKKTNYQKYDQNRGVRIGNALFKSACARAKELGFPSFAAYVRALVISDVNGFLHNVPKVDVIDDSDI